MTKSRYSRAERLALVTIALALLHHIEHVLRSVHSGWPFRSEVTPFTYSLLVYPAFAVLFAARGWPKLRIIVAALLAIFPTYAHVVLESVADQYIVWAARPEWNWLGVGSPAIGVLAVLVSVLLSLSAILTFIAFVRSGGV